MKFALKDFKNLIKIGEGTYGIVYKAVNLVTNELVALKKIKCKNDVDGLWSTTLREVAILKEIQHPNIITMHQTIIENGRLYMVFEYLDADLDNYLKNLEGPMNRWLVKNFSFQIMQGLLCCHTKGYIHRDLKPSNLLVNISKNIVKIADFGLARKYNSSTRILSHEVVTLMYRAPEILLNAEKYSTGIDVWSMACIIAEMSTGKLLFQGTSEIDQLFQIFKILGTPTEDVWPDVCNLPAWNSMFPVWYRKIEIHLEDSVDPLCLDLIMKMLEYYPPERISIRDALLHNYFTDLDKTLLPASDQMIERTKIENMFYETLY